MAATHTELNMSEKLFDITRDRLWADGLAEAFDEARKSGKFLLIATGAEPTKSWKLGVALAFMDEDMLSLSRRFHCVTVTDNRAADQRLADKPTLLICSPEGREIVSATADTIEELIPALRGMLTHVVAIEKTGKACPACQETAPVRLSIRQFFGVLAHAILG